MAQEESEYITSDSYDGYFRKLYAKVCAQCGATFYLPRHILNGAKFCSKKCHAKTKQRRETLTCSQCGKQFVKLTGKKKNSRHGFYFCTRACKDLAQRIGGIEEIRPGQYKNGKSYYRERALREYGQKCCQCGYDKYSAMLDVDHIDNNREHNSLENLQVLCVWCHALKTRKTPVHDR